MSLNNLAFLLPGQGVENLPQMTARLPEDRFAPPLGHEHNCDSDSKKRRDGIPANARQSE
jgi:hypothetical protein